MPRSTPSNSSRAPAVLVDKAEGTRGACSRRRPVTALVAGHLEVLRLEGTNKVLCRGNPRPARRQHPPARVGRPPGLVHGPCAHTGASRSPPSNITHTRAPTAGRFQAPRPAVMPTPKGRAHSLSSSIGPSTRAVTRPIRFGVHVVDDCFRAAELACPCLTCSDRTWFCHGDRRPRSLRAGAAPHRCWSRRCPCPAASAR